MSGNVTSSNTFLVYNKHKTVCFYFWYRILGLRRQKLLSHVTYNLWPQGSSRTFPDPLAGFFFPFIEIYLLSAFYVPGAFIGTGNTAMNKTNKYSIRLRDNMETSKQRVGCSEVGLEVPSQKEPTWRGKVKWARQISEGRVSRKEGTASVNMFPFSSSKFEKLMNLNRHCCWSCCL